MNRIRWAVSALAVAATVPLVSAPFSRADKAATAKADVAKAHSSATTRKSGAKPLPRFVSISTLETLRKIRGEVAPRLLDPIAPSMPELMKSKTPISAEDLAKQTRLRSSTGVNRNPKVYGERLAQLPKAGGRLKPARVPKRTVPVIPKWVRYPLEFQLGGIGLGSKAIDKDKFNRIDRYGLFAMHGNPTAVVVPVLQAATGGGGGGAAGGAAAGGAAGAGGAGGGQLTGGAAAAAATAPVNLTVNQQPPFGAELFPASQNGELPDWASAVTVQLDNNHVEWLYNRGTYAMGFVVDRLGYVDAIVMAGVESPIARTQLEDPVHTVKLGDDLRKVMSRYGYPDSVETYIVNLTAGVGVGTDTGAGAGGAAAGAAAGGGAAGTTQTGNGAFRTFELRYEQSYNVVFTIRYNRVVRIYIFGDPDFFNEQRRRQLRVAY